jgi:hypothetical protein
MVVVQTDGYQPGHFFWAYYSHSTNQWQFHDSQIDYRYTYGYYIPGTNGDLTITGVRDVPSTVAGGSDPNSYVFDIIKYFHTTSVTNPNLSEVIVKQDSSGNAGGHIAITTWISDTYIDTQGRTHILYDDNGTGYNAIIQNGAIVKDVPLQVGDDYKVRMIQDTTGKFYLLDLNGSSLDVYPASVGDTDGTQFDPAVSLSLEQYPSCPDGSSCQAPHLAVPRGGTPLADYVDGVYNSGQGEQWVYFRVNLRTSSTGTTPPTPTVTGSSTPNPSAVPTTLSPTPSQPFYPTPTLYWTLSMSRLQQGLRFKQCASKPFEARMMRKNLAFGTTIRGRGG